MMNREAWLNRMAEMLRPWFRDAGYPLHGRISVSMGTTKPKVAGYCTMQKHENDINYIIISAYEDVIPNGIEAGATLVHELLHAVLPPGTSHKQPFREAMVPLGLIGKPTHTEAGPRLLAHLSALCAHMPELPRYGLVRPVRPVRPKVDNGLNKFQCGGCKMTVYIKNHSLDLAGEPSCWNYECEKYCEAMSPA